MAQISNSLGSGGKLGMVMPLRWWYPAAAAPEPGTPPPPPPAPVQEPPKQPTPTDEPVVPPTIATGGLGAAGARGPEAAGNAAAQGMGRDLARSSGPGGMSPGAERAREKEKNKNNNGATATRGPNRGI